MIMLNKPYWMRHIHHLFPLRCVNCSSLSRPTAGTNKKDARNYSKFSTRQHKKRCLAQYEVRLSVLIRLTFAKAET